MSRNSQSPKGVCFYVLKYVRLIQAEVRCVCDSHFVMVLNVLIDAPYTLAFFSTRNLHDKVQIQVIPIYDVIGLDVN